MLQRRDHPRLSLGWPVSLLVWGVAGASGAAAVYGISPYNLLRDAGVATPCTDRHPPLVDRVMFNGFAKVDISISTISTCRQHLYIYHIYISTISIYLQYLHIYAGGLGAGHLVADPGLRQAAGRHHQHGALPPCVDPPLQGAVLPLPAPQVATLHTIYSSQLSTKASN